MKAELAFSGEWDLGDGSKAEAVVWLLPRSLRGSEHQYKYRLAYIVDGVCVLRFDNEVGKGDHVHVGRRQRPYQFTNVEALLADFWEEVDEWRKRRER